MPINQVSKVHFDDKGMTIKPKLLVERYPNLCKDRAKIKAILWEIYNDKGVSVDKQNANIELIFRQSAINYGMDRWFDINELSKQFSIPKDYYIYISLISFIEGENEIPILSWEYILDIESFVPEIIINQIYERIEFTRKYIAINNIISFLLKIKEDEIANDIQECIIRIDRKDWDGGIKFARKTIEGIKQINKKYDIFEGNRRKKVNEFLEKTFGLLSNFGEHHGTKGFEHEACFSKELVISSVIYCIGKLEELKG